MRTEAKVSALQLAVTRRSSKGPNAAASSPYPNAEPTCNPQ